MRNEKGQFVKGNTPWSKGKKGISLNTGRTHFKKGFKHTEESKNKISKNHRGLQGEETKKKLSKIRKGVKTGLIPWNKGKKTGIKHWLGKKRDDISGEKNYGWKGGITPLMIKIRHCFEYRQWRSDIFTRDNFTCQKCGRKGGVLNAHHLKSFALIIKENKVKTFEKALNCEELWNINNGQTLCIKCHKKTI